METYTLYNSADKERFLEICAHFEKELSEFKKLPPFEDKKQNAVYQRFELGQRAVVICLETLWNERIIAKANFDMSGLLKNITA